MFATSNADGISDADSIILGCRVDSSTVIDALGSCFVILGFCSCSCEYIQGS